MRLRRYRSLLRDASIGVKVLISPVLLIFALVVVSLLAIYGLNEQHAALAEVDNIALEKITLIDEFVALSERVQSDVFRIAVLNFMNLPQNEIQPIHTRLERGLSDMDVIYGQILVQWSLDETERPILERMKGPLDDFRLQAQQAATVVSDDPSFGVLLVRSSTIPFAEFRSALVEFFDYQRAKIARAEVESRQRVTAIGGAIVSLVFLITLTGILTMVLVSTRLISYPIRSITDLMRHLAEGDLSIEIGDPERRDEIGAMARAVEVFRDNAIGKARAEERLKEYSEGLEEMVNERTRELGEAQEQLVRRERLAVLGQLAGGVAHELRNPLGAIRNVAYFLNLALETPDPQIKRALGILDREVETSNRIISSLLDFARIKTPSRRSVNINAALREALSRADVPKSVEVVMQLDETLPAIQADPDQLEQIFGNLILNAIQAMSPPLGDGGQLTIRAETLAPDWVTVSVADTGVGVSEEHLDKLFEPLFTTKAKGIGLGLALTKILVEGHGGHVEVESQEGEGSIFTVKLPINCDFLA